MKEKRGEANEPGPQEPPHYHRTLKPKQREMAIRNKKKQNKGRRNHHHNNHNKKKKKLKSFFVSGLEWEDDLSVCKGGGGDGVHLAPTNSPTVKPSSPADEGKPFLFFFFMRLAALDYRPTLWYYYLFFSLTLYPSVFSLYFSRTWKKKGKRRSYTYYASFKYLE